MAPPRLARFNDHPSTTDFSGTKPPKRGKSSASASSAWKAINNELNAHKSQGVEVEPIRRAKISAGLARDHHRSERTSGKTRGIIKGKIG